ncbi:hypothetical protein Aab01nite_77960 [Paractinoplanes abujensis]|uniref:Uncharacterized protein n=1 Tax=Paractinoplanes abujensis TaxID=882441 RepID=A0A7W7CSU0_9ACTN|nr:hypothetical protein [Actinoplanes abujensis]MBB4692316.1 hypothetical protein [Actinoplanes abujensis]GID24206.1 hypothetical protein Aab01nite_77960 [Actinoplanes abujensis]
MNVVAEMLLNDPAPAAIWATLIVLTFPALLVLGSPEAMRHPGRMLRDVLTALRRHPAPSPSTCSPAWASEVRVAADRAAVAAQRWRDLWEQAETTMAAAYDAWLEADARLRTVTVAARWGTPWSAPTCAEYASRERFLHQAVAAACARGDLPAEALTDAQAGRNGWDARLHPVDQELVIAKAAAAYRRHCYDQAATAERTAWHDADLARRASSSLQHEAELATAPADLPSPTTAGISTHRPVAVPAL